MFQTNLLWQNDERWANLPLGSGPHTIKEWGCLMVDLCMVVNGYGYQETPQTFNDKMKSSGGFQGEYINAWVVPSIFPGVQTLSYDECESTPAPIAKIDAALAQGDPVIVQVDWSPNAGVQSHWVIAYAKEGSDYLVYDPYRYSGDSPDKKLTLLSRYKHQGSTLSQAISAVLFMTGSRRTSSGQGGVSGSTISTPPAKTPVPTDSFFVYAAVEDLAFRSAPSVGAALLKRVPERTAFKTLEKEVNAAAKLGQYGQWLHVQDPSGDQGYVAAWYLTEEPSGGAETAGNTASGSRPSAGVGSRLNGLVVTPTADGLALRSGGSFGADLIKRLPFTAKLKVLETPVSARNKVGKFNEWMNVQDIVGDSGYVAAWYVTETAAPVLGVKAETDDDESGVPDESEALVVRTTVDQLALRKDPVISGSTLLMRLPLQTELVLLDPEEEAKIGQIGQWLQVREVNGLEGYVAAWYVAK